jgi:branched-chain amino acid transport system substrate-binding protein
MFFKLRRKHIALLTLLAMLAMTIVGCGGGSDQDKSGDKANDVIKIGVYEPLTGTNAAGGQMTMEGIELANKLYPTVLGKKIELVTVDNKSEKQEAMAVHCPCPADRWPRMQGVRLLDVHRPIRL